MKHLETPQKGILTVATRRLTLWFMASPLLVLTSVAVCIQQGWNVAGQNSFTFALAACGFLGSILVVLCSFALLPDIKREPPSFRRLFFLFLALNALIPFLFLWRP